MNDISTISERIQHEVREVLKHYASKIREFNGSQEHALYRIMTDSSIQRYAPKRYSDTVFFAHELPCKVVGSATYRTLLMKLVFESSTVHQEPRCVVELGNERDAYYDVAYIPLNAVIDAALSSSTLLSNEQLLSLAEIPAMRLLVRFDKNAMSVPDAYKVFLT